MAGKFASRTEVTVEKSRNELESSLAKYGASRFGYATERGRAMIQFEANSRRVRFMLPLPIAPANSSAAAKKRFDQEARQAWRALLLVVKAKLEAVAVGITSFEDEFLAHTLLPDGRTFGEWAQDPVQSAMLDAGKMPPMLPGGK